MDKMEELQEQMQKCLKPKRYHHTLGVRYTAQALAMCHKEDMYAAGIAGLLHDCAKYLSEQEILAECKKCRIACSQTEMEQPHLLHAKLGAYYAQKKYGITDERILSAIRWHTTGKPDMNTLEKIVFIADYIEPGRKELPQMEAIRRTAYTDLEETMYLILDNTLRYLRGERIGSEEAIDRYTVEAYEYYKQYKKV